MRILMFSINPLFPDTITGGASKHLKIVAEHLGALGHEVRVLCARLEEHPPFSLGSGVEILPILQFKQPFPEPYAVAGYQLAHTFQTIADHLRWADRFYLHDGELLLPSLYADLPTVISLRDNCYAESVLGSFLFQGDALITVSDYSRQVILATAGRFYPEMEQRTLTINNGIDLERFRPTSPSPELLELLDLDPAQEVILLHPHRSESGKGLEQSLQVVRLLIERHGVTRLRLLVPCWVDVENPQPAEALYRSIEQRAEALGLRQQTHIHPWIPQRLMPEYLALGRVTLALGNCVEAFGNAVFESLACGTPAIAARVANYRGQLPDTLLNKVDYNDAESAAQIAAEIIHQRRRIPQSTRDVMARSLSIQAQREGYASAILNAEKRPPLRFQPPMITASTPFLLPPWCCRQGEHHFFHDFRGESAPLPRLAALLDRYAPVTREEAGRMGVTTAEFDRWYMEGYLTPSPMAQGEPR